MNFKIIERRQFADERGTLHLLEWNKTIPFSAKRFFWVCDVPIGARRGFHAHKSGRQLLICIKGSISVTLKTHDMETSILINDEGPGILVENMVWGEQQFLSSGAILLVVASNEYQESDYVRNFGDFLELSKQTC